MRITKIKWAYSILLKLNKNITFVQIIFYQLINLYWGACWGVVANGSGTGAKATDKIIKKKLTSLLTMYKNCYSIAS